MIPRTAQILALATDITRPTAEIAAATGVRRSTIHRALMRWAPELWFARSAAARQVSATEFAWTKCEGCGLRFRHRPQDHPRFCSRPCWYGTRDIGERAYAARRKGLTWPAIARMVGASSRQSAMLSAKAWAKRRGKAWPLRRT